MAPRIPIFISAVTSELKSARQLVANSLQFLGYEAVWQDIFGSEQGDLRGVLRKKIDDCKGVIQLVGHSYGAEPPVAEERWGRVSYTQYEALYARDKGKKVWYLLLQEDFVTDPHADEPKELRELQAAYRRRVQADMQIYHSLASHEALEVNVLKMRDDFAGLRRGVKRWAMAVMLLLLLLCGIVLWIVHNQGVETKSVQAQGRQVATAVDHSATELKGITTELARIRLTNDGKSFGDLPPDRQEELNRQIKILGIDDLLTRSRNCVFPSALDANTQQMGAIVAQLQRGTFTNYSSLKASFQKCWDNLVNVAKERAKLETATHEQVTSLLGELEQKTEGLEGIEDSFPANFQERSVVNAIVEDLSPRLDRETKRLGKVDMSLYLAPMDTRAMAEGLMSVLTQTGNKMIQDAQAVAQPESARRCAIVRERIINDARMPTQEELDWEVQPNAAAGDFAHTIQVDQSFFTQQIWTWLNGDNGELKRPGE